MLRKILNCLINLIVNNLLFFWLRENFIFIIYYKNSKHNSDFDIQIDIQTEVSFKNTSVKRFKSSRKVSPEQVVALKKAFHRSKNSVCPSDGDGGAISA